MRATLAQIEKFLNDKLNWLERVMERNNAENCALEDVIQYKKILLKGDAYPLIASGSAKFDGKAVYFRTFNDLKKILVGLYGTQFLGIFRNIAEKFNFNCTKVGFKDYKSRWGCCSAKKEIVFNYKLLMLPEKFWRYVIAHELCHTVHMNHSGKFYGLLEAVMPDFACVRHELKAFDRLTRLY